MAKINMITADEFQTSERFYALPKILFESDRYKQMRLDTKVAYSILKDRLSLSLKNNWIDEKGYIFLVYSNANLMEILNCSKSTLLRIKKQLSEYGLIYEVKQSNSQKGTLANKIYLGQLIDDKSTRTLVNNDFSELDTPRVSDLDQGGTRFKPGGYQIQTLMILIIVILILVTLIFLLTMTRKWLTLVKMITIKIRLTEKSMKQHSTIEIIFGDLYMTV